MEPHALDLKTIFCEALERRAGPDRLAYLDEACRENPALRAQIEDLVRAHERAAGFLDSAADAATSPATSEPDEDATLAARPLAEGPGSRIGPYKLLQEIG